ncbi:uroporphyrinogen decarboxylase family protein [Dankookia rubra]|uniref:uroporphyrinogen decarboxylase family protein n=1 Tax=Dankookia rubra TaxID=1442381 RepID=UPI0014097F91|nr:uroporphyrinogen decarboxylase family protein [Dankookia rubra]
MARALVGRSGGRYPVFATVLNPFGQMRDRYGWARMAGWIAEDPAAVGAALRRVASGLAVLARDCVAEAGTAGIFFASQGVEAGRRDHAAFAALVAEPDHMILDAATAAGSCAILHACGEDLVLPRYRGYRAAAVNWDAAHSHAADGLWPGACRLPGPDLRGALLDGDAAAIRAAVRDLPRAEAGGPQLQAAACTVSSDLPFWRVRAALADEQPAHAGGDRRHETVDAQRGKQRRDRRPVFAEHEHDQAMAAGAHPDQPGEGQQQHGLEDAPKGPAIGVRLDQAA